MKLIILKIIIICSFLSAQAITVENVADSQFSLSPATLVAAAAASASSSTPYVITDSMEPPIAEKKALQKIVNRNFRITLERARETQIGSLLCQLPVDVLLPLLIRAGIGKKEFVSPCLYIEMLRQDVSIPLTLSLESMEQFEERKVCLFPKSGLIFKFTPTLEQLEAIISHWRGCFSYVSLAHTSIKDVSPLSGIQTVNLYGCKSLKKVTISDVHTLILVQSSVIDITEMRNVDIVDLSFTEQLDFIFDALKQITIYLGGSYEITKEMMQVFFQNKVNVIIEDVHPLTAQELLTEGRMRRKQREESQHSTQLELQQFEENVRIQLDQFVAAATHSLQQSAGNIHRQLDRLEEALNR